MEKNELMGVPHSHEFIFSIPFHSRKEFVALRVRQTLCERSERATEKPENGSGRKFKILWIWGLR